MKKIYLLATILLGLSAQLMAQAPQGINYQAVIRNPNGTTVNNSNISLQMRILQGSASGTAVYVETFTETTSNIGLVNIVIGTGTVVAGDFTTIDWGNGPYFMEVGADTGGGTGYVVMGTQQMMSVPYALYAENSGTPGPQGPQGIQGDPGPQGPTGATGPQGPAGATGPQGPQGVAGPQGPAGADGVDGTDGTDGLSAYEVWLSQGNTGTEADFLTSLQGADGAVGATGPQGPQGVAGPQGPAGADGQGGVTTAGTNISITGTGTVGDPYVVNATDNVNDADSDPNNELQTLTVSNDSLMISNGNGIPLWAFQGASASAHGYINLTSDSSIVFYHNALVEVTMKSGNGGKGGNTCNNTVLGKNGGSGAGVRVLIYVSALDTLNLKLGANGSNGCSCCIVNNSCFDSGQSGADGSDAIISINDPSFANPVIIAQGGTGGQGGYLVWSGACTVPTVNSGNNGNISYGPAYNTSGCFVLETNLGGGGGTTVRW